MVRILPINRKASIVEDPFSWPRKKPLGLATSVAGFIVKIWLPDLGSNQGPTD